MALVSSPSLDHRRARPSAAGILDLFAEAVWQAGIGGPVVREVDGRLNRCGGRLSAGGE